MNSLRSVPTRITFISYLTPTDVCHARHLEIHVAPTAAGTGGSFDPENSVTTSVPNGELSSKRSTDTPLLVNAAYECAGRAEHLHALKIRKSK